MGHLVMGRFVMGRFVCESLLEHQWARILNTKTMKLKLYDVLHLVNIA
jgi:hypothetical protein